MRTTVNLDDDVAAAVKDIQKSSGMGLSAALNELARRGLSVPRQRQPFVQATSSGHALVDVRNIGEVLDVLDEPRS
ncbi:hypothetical protein [Actinomycetospora sp. NBRC 106378]|uniref:hypothetical protein n=1 Tax=Actinomycetospora sp. NBRC 106378 TaxID=3032208 RepID=UPI0024A3136F|nr:hypothetical protein [Actinomycetospora sp. NBRC 106378]GLZ52731.1 hypothetical protein Acsp07_23480 [Actinomycetospora sp. NBRC 106378]